MPLTENLSITDAERMTWGYSNSLIAKYRYIKTSLDKILLCEKKFCGELKKIPPKDRRHGRSSEFDLFFSQIHERSEVFKYYSEYFIMNITTSLDIIAILFELIYSFSNTKLHNISFNLLTKACTEGNNNIPNHIKDIILANDREWIGYSEKKMLSQLRNYIAHHSIIANVSGGTLSGPSCRVDDNLYFRIVDFFLVDDMITKAKHTDFIYLHPNPNPQFFSVYFKIIFKNIRELIITIIKEVLPNNLSKLFLPYFQKSSVYSDITNNDGTK